MKSEERRRKGRDRGGFGFGSGREREGVRRPVVESQRGNRRSDGLAGGRPNFKRQDRQRGLKKKSKSYEEEFSVGAAVMQQGLEFCRNLVSRTLRGDRQIGVIQ